MEGSGSLQCSQFPPGFRFHPTDQELIIHYLRKKITSTLPPSSSIIADVDLYKFNPWDLPEKAFFGEGEWFFFSPRDRKYPNGVRPNRAAACGYWKATGTDKPILAANGSQCLGVKKALVFYKGRPPKGIKSDWVMNEYRLLDSSSSMSHKLKGTMRLDDWVLCRVRHKASLVVESDEKPAPLPLLVTSAFTKSLAPFERQQLGGNEQSNLFEVGDGQLMGYLLGSASQADSAGESSELCHAGGMFMGEQQQQPELVTSTLSSIKRKLSFGTLDELMMLQQGKRFHHHAAGGQISPAGSDSVDQECLEFLI